jgi:hypothetical protein
LICDRNQENTVQINTAGSSYYLFTLHQYSHMTTRLPSGSQTPLSSTRAAVMHTHACSLVLAECPTIFESPLNRTNAQANQCRESVEYQVDMVDAVHQEEARGYGVKEL